MSLTMYIIIIIYYIDSIRSFIEFYHFLSLARIMKNVFFNSKNVT